MVQHLKPQRNSSVQPLPFVSGGPIISCNTHANTRTLHATMLQLPNTCPHAQTVDNWWSSGATCLIPGDVPTYPTNFPSNLVCGGEAGVYATPLLDSNNVTYGNIVLFRDYQHRLIATVALDGSAGSQWLMQVPTGGERG